jgi:alkanesulfonate monooxygenase SsuD/methylene tetrahydromethanopterin reductase-like flavin-dependent oxidoreductase (luciferase family)
MVGIDIDITQNRPLRLGLALADGVLWDNGIAAERVRATDLGDIWRKSARLRRDRPDVDIVADIEIVIAADSRTARSLMGSTDVDGTEGTLLYVGTPSGLAGLIADIHALGIADGAVLIPKAAGAAELVRDAVLPLLDTMLRLPRPASTARPA